MKCLNETQMSRYFSDEVSEDETGTIREHLLSCLECRSLYEDYAKIANRIKADNAAYHSDAEIHKIMTIIDVGKANTVSFRVPRVVSVRKLMSVAAILLASVVIGGIWLAISEKKADIGETFQERSDGTPHPDNWVSLQIFENNDGKYEQVTDTISPSASLAFKYKDFSPKPHPYLMILAVDEAGRVLWYYPPYLDEKSNPHSISISSKKGEDQLSDEVSHNYKSGLLNVIGIFSKTPLTVRDVESNIAKNMTQAHAFKRLDRLDLEATAQYVKTLKVESRR